MKKCLSLLLAVLQTWLILPGLFSPALAAENELTILAYICGSDLESDAGQASGDIEEMIASGIGSAPGVSVLLATGGSTSWQEFGISSRSVQYYRLGASRPELLKDAGKKNMGSPDTLSEFIRYGIANAPARRYILIIWDHGGGPVYGVCNDANFRDDGLSLSELHSGLLSGLGGNRLEIIAFDCCLMNCIDLCADMADVADYSVVSQEMVAGSGMDYDVWMKLPADNPSVSAEKIAMEMASSYVADNSSGFYADTATMSVISSEKMSEVVRAAEAFCAALENLVASNLSSIVRLRTGLTSFGEFVEEDATDLVDLSDMCDAFAALLPAESAALKAAAEQAVCYNCTTKDISSYAHGLSFFLPYETVSYSSSDILDHYSSLGDSYSSLVVSLTSQAYGSSYSMSASSYTPQSFYSCDDSGCSGSFCDIWDGYYGDYCSFDDAWGSCDGDIWYGLDTECGSVWDGYTSSSGLWDGYDVWGGYDDSYGSWEDDYYYDDPQGGGSWGGNQASGTSIWGGLSTGGNQEDLTPTASGTWASDEGSQSGSGTSSGGIWGGMDDSQTSSAASTQATQSSGASQGNNAASVALTNIWAGLLNTGEDYYQPGEENQNLQAGVTEAAPAETVLASAGSYFSSATLTSQMIYSVQLNKTDLDHLATASGVLSLQKGDEIIRLGNMGSTTVDWSTGLIFSMFDGSWPTLNGQMVRAEFLYADDEGNTRFVIPARVNGLKMYLLGRKHADGTAEILGATQGYDEYGFAIRGSIPLENGMTVAPLFTAVSADGTERIYDGEPITVAEGGLTLTWAKVPEGTYLYSFGLTDLAGITSYTDTATVTF